MDPEYLRFSLEKMNNDEADFELNELIQETKDEDIRNFLRERRRDLLQKTVEPITSKEAEIYYMHLKGNKDGEITRYDIRKIDEKYARNLYNWHRSGAQDSDFEKTLYMNVLGTIGNAFMPF